MGVCCSTEDASDINKPINWRTISPIEQRVTLFSEAQFMKMRVEMIKELSLFMNALHETEEAGYSVLKNKRKDHLAKRYTQFHPASAVSGDDGQELVKEGLFEGEEEAEKQRRLDPKNKNKKDKMTSSTLDFVPPAEAEYVAKLSDMEELQTMFSVACALGKLTDARDIFELGIKKLQQRRKQEEHQQTATPRHYVQFDINKPLNCFHRPDLENKETVRWTPLQLAIASFSSTGLFMLDSSISRTRDNIARLNDKIIRAHQEFDVRKRREQEYRIYDVHNAFVEEGLNRFRLNHIPRPTRSSMHRHNKKEKEQESDDDDDDIPSAPNDLHEYDVQKMKFKVPQRIQEANKKRLADFVEFLLSEGADPNGNPKETKGINDENGERYLKSKAKENEMGDMSLLPGPDPEEQVKVAIDNGKSIMHHDHPLFLAIRGCGAHSQRVPNELVVAELLAQNETIVDPIATHVSSVLDAHTFRTPLFTLCESLNNGVSSQQDKNNNSASNDNAALPPRLQAVSLLIARGADKNFVSLIEKGMGFNRFSPLNAAQHCGNQELEKLLEANGCVAQVQPPKQKERRRRSSMELHVAL